MILTQFDLRRENLKSRILTEAL